MKYEIINPSDKCFITSENEMIARFCNLLLGQGMYGLKRDDGTDADCIYLFGYSQKCLDADYEGDFKEFSYRHAKEIAECFNSFEYASEPTSVNYIGGRAKELAEIFKKMAEDAQ